MAGLGWYRGAMTLGQAFIACGVDIETAKIMTIGERAEDVFYITDEAGAPLDGAAVDALRDELYRRLDSAAAA